MRTQPVFFFLFRFLLSIGRGTNIFRVVVLMRYIPGSPVPTCSALSRRLFGTIRQSALSIQRGYGNGDSGWLYLIPHCRSLPLPLGFVIRFSSFLPSFLPSFLYSFLPLFLPFTCPPNILHHIPDLQYHGACCRNHVNTIYHHQKLALGAEESFAGLTCELVARGMLSFR